MGKDIPALLRGPKGTALFVSRATGYVAEGATLMSVDERAGTVEVRFVFDGRIAAVPWEAVAGLFTI